MMLKRVMKENAVLYLDGEQCVLEIREEEKDGKAWLYLKGELRSELTHDFQDELTALVIVGVPVVLDFQVLSYFSASAGDVLVEIQQKIDAMGKGELLIRNVPEAIYEKDFIKTGLAELLWIKQA